MRNKNSAPFTLKTLIFFGDSYRKIIVLTLIMSITFALFGCTSTRNYPPSYNQIASLLKPGDDALVNMIDGNSYRIKVNNLSEYGIVDSTGNIIEWNLISTVEITELNVATRAGFALGVGTVLWLTIGALLDKAQTEAISR